MRSQRFSVVVLAISASLACNGTTVKPPSLDYTVTVSPTSASVTAGKKVQLGFVSAGPVAWSVQDTGGGTVDANGLYTAPAAAGTFHVVATSQKDSTKTGTVVVTVIAAPVAPSITAPRLITTGKAGSASVAAVAGGTFAWTIFNGTINGSATGASIAFTAGDLGETVLGAAALNSAGDASAETIAVVGVIAAATPPVITAPAAVTTARQGLPASVATSPGITYAWTLTGGTITSGAATDTIAFTSGPVGTIAITCTATNAAGDAAAPIIVSVSVRDHQLELIAGATGGPGYNDGPVADARFAFINGLAFDPADGTTLYVSDTNNRSIRKVANGMVTTLAGSAALDGGGGYSDGVGPGAQFGGPWGIGVDGKHDVFVADHYGETVRRVSPDGATTSLAGSAFGYGETNGFGPAAKFRYPTALTVNDAGTVITVTETSAAGIVRQVLPNPDGGDQWQATTYGTSSTARLYGVAVASDGGVFLSEQNQNVVAFVSNGVAQPVAGSGNASFLDGTGTAAGYYFPRGLAFDPSDHLFVADTVNNAIREITIDAGSYVTTTVTDAGLNQPADLARSGDGTLYFTEGTLNAVHRLGSAGPVVTAGAEQQAGAANGRGGAARFSFGGNFAGVARDGLDLYVADSANNTIRKVAADGTVSNFAGTPGPNYNSYIDGLAAGASFSSPTGLAVDRTTHAVYVTDTRNCAIRSISYDPAYAANVVFTVAGGHGCSNRDGQGADAGFSNPTGIAASNDGNTLYVADNGNSLIRQLVLDADAGAWNVTTIGGRYSCERQDGEGVDAGFCGPSSLALDQSGNLFVADTGNEAIRKMTFNAANHDWITTTVVPGDPSFNCPFHDGETTNDGGVCNPTGIAFDTQGRLFVSDYNAVKMLSPVGDGTSWMVQTVAGTQPKRAALPGPLPASLNYAAGLAGTALGDIAVTDTLENTLFLLRAP